MIDSEQGTRYISRFPVYPSMRVRGSFYPFLLVSWYDVGRILFFRKFHISNVVFVYQDMRNNYERMAVWLKFNENRKGPEFPTKSVWDHIQIDFCHTRKWVIVIPIYAVNAAVIALKHIERDCTDFREN